MGQGGFLIGISLLLNFDLCPDLAKEVHGVSRALYVKNQS